MLELHLEDISRVQEAVTLLADIGKEAARADENGMLIIPVTHRRQSLLEAVRRLDSANIALADVTLRRPTLDEIFLELTGNRA